MSSAVSVVMSVYDGEKYLKEAVESILSQTFADFEFIILNDGSTDSSYSILQEFSQRDARIHLYDNEKNLGLPRSLNRGLELARGQYIARMDPDDICFPERLDKQVRYMQTHPEIGVCGSWVQVIGRQAGEIWKYPCAHDEIYSKMLFENSLVHPTVMIRVSSLRQHALSYNVHAVNVEDYDLWSRALPLMRFANIPEVLLQYRLHDSNVNLVYRDKQRAGRVFIYQRFASQLKMEYAQDELALHEQISSYRYGTDLAFVKRARCWLEKNSCANRRSRLIPAGILDAELGMRWTEICQHSKTQPIFNCFEILSSSLPFAGASGLHKLWRGIKFSLGRIIPAKRR